MDKYLDTFMQVSALEVLAATVAMYAVSSIWFAVLFADKCAELKGVAPGENCNPTKSMLIKGFLAYIPVAFLIGVIDVHAQGNPIAIFASVGVVWLFMFFDMIHATIWEEMPFKLFLIYIFNTLATYSAAGTVFWQIS
ncbi:MAG: hypothetical protein MRY32_08430 [Rickettsiales bacterium]|nr:hypothetical protein [Rickettsiales bacterium]